MTAQLELISLFELLLVGNKDVFIFIGHQTYGESGLYYVNRKGLHKFMRDWDGLLGYKIPITCSSGYANFSGYSSIFKKHYNP